jgi:signal transduction histidine kinase/ActR/RegA family two-component response regulator
MIGTKVFEFVHADDTQAAQEAFARVLLSPGTSESIEVRFRHRNGSWNVLEAVSKSITDDSHTVRIIINSRDITERKKLENDILKSQKLESLGILAGGIAHDFNNLITGITANIELARMHAKRGHELHTILKKAEQASARARDLTQQLLTFSMGGEPIKKILLINDVIRESAEFALRGSKSVCTFSVPNDLWPVEADEGQLRQVIHNIVINADQSMPQGGVITVACENVTIGAREVQVLTPGDYVKIAIADRGIGIPKEHRSKIFDPYFTTKQKGSGLGLATSYSIIKKHGGEIAVESEIGIGTTLELFLPASRKEFQTASDRRSDALVSGSGSILIMDDEEIVRDAAGRILQTAGYEVALATDGNEAIELYRKARESGKPFDAVILDLTVPGGIGGKDALKILLGIDPAVRAIVSSGYSHDPIMAHYQDYGFRGVIAKPYKIREMSEIVNRVITEAPVIKKTGPE